MIRTAVLLVVLAAPQAALAAWPVANGDLSSRRATTATALDAGSASTLRVAWRFRLPPGGAGFGAITGNPVIAGTTVYVQDSRSSVYALDVKTGAVRWKHGFAAPNDGPNGVAVSGARVYGATDTSVFALDAATGRRLWGRRLANRREQFVGISPVVDRGRVYVSTQGFSPGGRGAIYALSAATGRIVWRFDTIAAPWPQPTAGGGGAWNPVSVDGRGDVYAGNSNPDPWGGTARYPNGGVFAGPALYTDSLLVLAGSSGRLLWFDQVTPHDVRDYDFQASPILTPRRVFGAGKAGRVVAWDRTTHDRVWSRAVGTHRRDLGPLPRRPAMVCPGLLGGVLTPMAYAHGRLFVPVVELCSRESATTSPSAFARPPAQGNGVLYALDAATGKTAWRRALGSPPFGCATVARDAVIVPTYDGRVTIFAARSGSVVWHRRLAGGINACPAVGGRLLVVAAGVGPSAEVVGFAVRG